MHTPLAPGRPKVLWLMQYAPHYREGLLRGLGEHWDLTVSATPCSDHLLIEPEERKGYRYQAGRGLPFLEKFGLHWLPREYRLVGKNQWHVILCVEDMHYPLRYLLYLRWLFSTGLRPKWVWWGHFFGKRNWRVLRFIRRFLVNHSDGALAYTEEVRQRLMEMGCLPEKVVSANNSDIHQKDICPLPLPAIHNRLNVLFVGRYLEEKRIERLLRLAERSSFIHVRLIGPGMRRLESQSKGLGGRVEFVGPKTGASLRADFEWCHLVANPGSLGLQVLSAAKHGRCIVVDRGSRPSPEVAIARKAGQPFINWGDSEEVDRFFEAAYAGKVPLEELGSRLAEHVGAQYTIEKSVQRFLSIF